MENSATVSAAQLQAGQNTVCAMRSEIENVVIGKREQVDLLLTAMLSGGHVLIEDVPGTGKTTLASALAAVCGLVFRRAQFTPDVMASDITGFNIYNRREEKFEFTDGLVMCNVLLADEINRASPKTQSALLEAMEEGNVTVDGVTYPLPVPFMVVATQNPAGFVGTYPLPEAQLDRFSVRVSLGYPAEAEEIRMLSDRHGKNPLDAVKKVTDAETILRMKQQCAETYIDEKIYKYIVQLTAATRRSEFFALGGSPRASLTLSKMAGASAFIHGRGYVIPEDVAGVFIPVMSHRVVLKQEARIAKQSADRILSDILKSVDVPLLK